MKVSGSIVLVAALLCSCIQRDDHLHDARHGADIVVTATGPAPVIAAGRTAAFAVNVVNTGPEDASDVGLLDTLSDQGSLVSITCKASSGAVCPDPPALSMKVAKLPNGGSLDFVVNLKLSAAATGTLVNSFAASFDKDPDPNNNSVAVDVIVR